MTAIKHNWKPNPATNSESFLLLFSDWFPLARKQEIALGLQKTEDGILICTASGEWVNFEAMKEQYPIESLKEAESQAA